MSLASLALLKYARVLRFHLIWGDISLDVYIQRALRD